MRRACSLLVPLAALLAAAVPAAAATVVPAPRTDIPRDTPAFVPDRVIVRFKHGADAADRAGARGAVDAVSARRLPLARTELVRLPRGRSVAAALRRLRGRPEVERAGPDVLYRTESIPNDPFFADQWGLNNTGQSGGLFGPGTPDADIDAPEAWDVTTGSQSVRVGVIDTGVDAAHPDLSANVDTANAFDFVNNDANTSDDVEGHGTAVASIIGAVGNNGIGMTGVAQHVSILPLQVDDASAGLSSSGILDAVNYARTHGVRVVNMSFGRYATIADPNEDPFLVAAIEAAPDILFSASAGNFNSLGQANDNDVTPHWPSNLTTDHANVIALANTTNLDVLDTSSSFGHASVDLAAPGTDIVGAAGTHNWFSENFDTTAVNALPTNWTATGSWTVTDERAASQPNSLTDSPGANYPDNSDTAATSPTFTVPSNQKCTVTNVRRRNTQLSHDYFITEVSLDAGPFTEIEKRSGDTTGLAFGIASPRFQTGSATQAALRFRLTSDGTATGDGVHVDDVSVDCAPASSDSYVSGVGTSFSAPMVSGAAALLLARDPTLTAAQLKSTLRNTVDPLGSLSGKVSTGGRLNVGRAMRSLTAPDATTSAADGVSKTGALLHGTVNPQGSPAQAHFEYRRVGDANWSATPGSAVGEGAAAAVSASVSGLAPDTDYEFRAVATKLVRSATGQTLGFRTQPNPVVVVPANIRDTQAPVVSQLAVAPSAFLPLRAGATIAKATSRGARVRFRVDEPATVTVSVLAPHAGRRAGSRCVKPARANRRARRCTRYVTVGTQVLRGALDGGVSRRFSGRVGRKALAPGRYRLQVVATDLAGNRSRPATTGFRIARR